MTRPTPPSEWVTWLGEPASSNAALVGPKAAHLSALARSHRVPDGFCITADAYRLAERAGGMPDELAGAVRDAYVRLVGAGRPGDAPPSVAVRSSAIDEDGPTASFAGQHDTILNVVGIDAVLAAVERTWRSLRSDAALAYRRAHGLPLTGLALAVLVQRLVLADASGVAFSIDPVSGRSDRIVVNASWGLGESMVDGTVTPDAWTLDVASLAPLEVRIAAKARMTVAVDGGTHEVAVPSFMQGRASLTDDQVAEVAALARSLETHQGWPVDIEFAYEGGRLHLLQCRPVTSAGREAA